MRLLWILLLWCAASTAIAEPELLEPEKAFRFSARAASAGMLEVNYEIAPGYYLYRDKFQFRAEPAQATLGAAQFPPGKIKQDEFFGKVETYRGDLRIVLPVAADGVSRIKLTVTSQGCADIGVCYTPQESHADIVLATATAGTAPPWVPAPGADSDESRIAALFKAGFWALIGGFFGFGLLLALTPCMFPMFPILSGILVPHGQHLTKARGLALSTTYVLGMAVTYAIAGVAAGLLGTMLAAALQTPWVLGLFAAMFVALALSMFGFYELQLPLALQTRLTEASNRLHGGHFASVFAMGVVSALIVGPCVAAPLAGALLYIGQSRDVVLGGSALFAMALGMGMPLIAVGASAGTLLPKAGPWMESVNRFFGAVLLGTAIYLVSPVVPAPVSMLAWAALLIVSAIYLHALDPLPPAAAGMRRFWKGVGVIALLVGVAILVGVLSGSRDILQPLSGLRFSANQAPAVTTATFRRVASLDDLDVVLGSTKGPVMLDFYADWCVSCKEMERFTFEDPQIQARFRKMALLQADVTANTEADKAMLQRFGLFGPPGIVFFDAQGREIKGLRVIGFEPADRFAAILDRVLN